MADNVVDLGEVREQLEASAPDDEIELTIFAGDFHLGQNAGRGLSYTIKTKVSLCFDVIEKMRSNGGVWLPPDGDTCWYIPWPPAAIRIRPSGKDAQ